MDVSVLASRTVTLHPVRRMDSEALDNGLIGFHLERCESCVRVSPLLRIIMNGAGKGKMSYLDPGALQ